MPDEFQQLFNKQEEIFVGKCQREVEACENIIKVQRENEEKLINVIKKLRSQKEKEEQNKEDQNKENITMNVPNSFAAAIKGQNVLPNFRKILRDERMNEIEEEHQQDRRFNGVWCQ